MPHQVRLLSLDLSKASTGFCLSMSEYDEEAKAWNVQRTVSGSIKVPSQGAHTYKHPHVSTQGIKARISELLEKYEAPEGYQTQVTIEHPIFESLSSPLQFYIHQTLLEFFDELGFNVVAFSTGMVKSFLANMAGQSKAMKGMDKKFLDGLYKEIYPTLIPKAYRAPQDLTSSDELDAIILNLLGLTTQALPLSAVHRLLPSPQLLFDKFTVNREIYRNLFLSFGVATLKDSQLHASFYATMTKKLKTNGHLSLNDSKMFYPYEALWAVSTHLTYLRDSTNYLSARKELYQKLSESLKFNLVAKTQFLEGTEPMKVYTHFDSCLYVDTPYSLKGI